MRKLAAGTIVVVVAGALVAFAQAEPGTRSALTPLAGQGDGLVEVSPTAADKDGLSFDVQGTLNIHSTTPSTDFTVLRRVDLNADGVCTGPVWLTLPGDPVLTTSPGGAGALHFEIQRGAPLVDGTRFDVIWRAVGVDGTILESDCLTVTVK